MKFLLIAVVIVAAGIAWAVASTRSGARRPQRDRARNRRIRDRMDRDRP